MVYTLFIERDVHDARKTIPGNVRQRIKRAFDALVANPRPSDSQPLDVTGIAIPSGIELRRLRIERWRVVYAVSDAEAWVWVLRVAKRPPYDYSDLVELARRLE